MGQQGDAGIGGRQNLRGQDDGGRDLVELPELTKAFPIHGYP